MTDSNPNPLVIVTATLDPEKTAEFWPSWHKTSDTVPPLVMYENRPNPEGPVPAFAAAIDLAVRQFPEAEILALLHDDLRIDRQGWDTSILEFFRTHPKCGLLGFGGALGVGRLGMYQEPYDPMSLARHDFRSNMQEAETHGERVYAAERVAVLDGFSLVGRKALILQGFHEMLTAGMVHHVYDVYLGCLAAREGWEVWLLPFACHHHGGMSAVGDPRYASWAREKDPEGDAGFWKHSHRVVWEEFRDVLPLRVEGREEE